MPVVVFILGSFLALLQVLPHPAGLDGPDPLTLHAIPRSKISDSDAAVKISQDRADVRLGELGHAMPLALKMPGPSTSLLNFVSDVHGVRGLEEMSPSRVLDAINDVDASFVMSNAAADIAGVADDVVLGEFLASDHLPCEPMRLHIAERPRNEDSAVASDVWSVSPQPARLSPVDLRPEALNGERRAVLVVAGLATELIPPGRAGRSLTGLEGVSALETSDPDSRFRALGQYDAGTRAELTLTPPNLMSLPSEGGAARAADTLKTHQDFPPGVTPRAVDAAPWLSCALNYTSGGAAFRGRALHCLA